MARGSHTSVATNKKTDLVGSVFLLEVAPGFEPGWTDLQSAA